MKMVLIFDTEDHDACYNSFELATKFMLRSMKHAHANSQLFTASKIDIVRMLRSFGLTYGAGVGLKEITEFYGRESSKYLKPLYEGAK